MTNCYEEKVATHQKTKMDSPSPEGSVKAAKWPQKHVVLSDNTVLRSLVPGYDLPFCKTHKPTGVLRQLSSPKVVVLLGHPSKVGQFGQKSGLKMVFEEKPEVWSVIGLKTFLNLFSNLKGYGHFEPKSSCFGQETFEIWFFN